MTEHDRLAYLAACEAEALDAVPPPSPQPSVPDHSAEIMSAHQGYRPAGTPFSVAAEAVS